MRNLNVWELAAMWLYHNEYSAQRKGAIEFYLDLLPSETECVHRMVRELLDAAQIKRKVLKPSVVKILSRKRITKRRGLSRAN